MTTLDRFPAASALPRFGVQTLRRGVGRLLRALSNRRHLGDLAELSDHHLADIGLERGDLARAAGTAPGVDPTTVLARCRDTRSRRRA